MPTLSHLVCVNDFEKEARSFLPKSALGYYESGALGEQTLHDNKLAIQRWYIRPRMMIDVSRRSLATTVLGHEVKVPFGVAPTAMQRMAHPDGECATAKAAARLGTIFTLSTISTSSIEEVAEKNGLRFFQLYIYKDRDVTAQLVLRAEKAGYKTLVLTVDAPSFGIRYADVRNQFKLPAHLRIANFESGDEKATLMSTSKGGSGINEYVASLFDPSLTWKDVAWLKSITSLPIVLKGILTAEDAMKGVSVGASAIWVSNHGARQVDGVFPSIDALQAVVKAVRGRCEVYVDGGFRTGSDIFKALAIGARMVFVGRPLIWGLACGGEQGAYKVLKLLENELSSVMALSGYPSVDTITPEAVVKGTSSKL